MGSNKCTVTCDTKGFELGEASRRHIEELVESKINKYDIPNAHLHVSLRMERHGNNEHLKVAQGVDRHEVYNPPHSEKDASSGVSVDEDKIYVEYEADNKENKLLPQYFRRRKKVQNGKKFHVSYRLSANGIQVVSERNEDDLYAALDLASSTLSRRIVKLLNMEQSYRKKFAEALEKFPELDPVKAGVKDQAEEFLTPEIEEELAEKEKQREFIYPHVIAEKSFKKDELHELYMQEAIDRADKLGSDFFVFRCMDDEKQRIKVVIPERKNGDEGGFVVYCLGE